MRQILIIADDLSGAADCGIACTASGLNVVVTLGEHTDEIDADVLSVDADTRHMSSLAAADVTTKLMQRYATKDKIVFKKLDSTLRGNIGAEIAVILKSQRELTSDRV